jgi:hypothetical protein
MRKEKNKKYHNESPKSVIPIKKSLRKTDPMP